MNEFEQVLKDYCDELARKDKAFAKAYAKKTKSIEKCAEYIISEARKRASKNMAAIPDDEVYGMAVHYFHEDGIDEPKQTVPVKVACPEKSKKKTERKAKVVSMREQVQTPDFTIEMPLFDI